MSSQRPHWSLSQPAHFYCHFAITIHPLCPPRMGLALPPSNSSIHPPMLQGQVPPFPWNLTSPLFPEIDSRNFSWPFPSSPVPGHEYDISLVLPCLLEGLSIDSLIHAFIQQSFIGYLSCARHHASSHV